MIHESHLLKLSCMQAQRTELPLLRVIYPDITLPVAVANKKSSGDPWLDPTRLADIYIENIHLHLFHRKKRKFRSPFSQEPKHSTPVFQDSETRDCKSMFSCVQGNGLYEPVSPSPSYVPCIRMESNISDLNNPFKILTAINLGFYFQCVVLNHTQARYFKQSKVSSAKPTRSLFGWRR